jgi:hypothetical protein
MEGAISELERVPPDPRREQLVELLDRLPPQKAEKLQEMLRSQVGTEPVSPLLADIIRRLALRAGDGGEDQPNALMRRVCTLFEPFLVSSPEQAAGWAIQRSSLMPWWHAAMAASATARRCEENFIEAVKAQDPNAIEQAVSAAYDRLSEATQVLVIRGATPGLRQDLRKLATLLANRRALGAALAALEIEGPLQPGREIELDEVLTANFAREYVVLARASDLDPAWLGHAVMNRLARPWTGLLLVRAVIDSGEIVPLAQVELAPLVNRSFSHLVQLGRGAEQQLRRAGKTRLASDIARAAVLTERYFAALDELTYLVDMAGFSCYAQARLTEREGVVIAVAETLGLFEAMIGHFLRQWSPRQSDEDDPELTAALDAASLLGTVKTIAAGYSFERPAEAISARVAELLARTPAAATGPALRQWGRHKAGLMHNLRLELA